MKKYFVVANSFAAPFCSDTSTEFVSGNSPKEAMQKFMKKYDHPAGLYAAVMYNSSDDYHKNKKTICRVLCAEARFMEKQSGAYTVRKEQRGVIYINDVKHTIKDPTKLLFDDEKIDVVTEGQPVAKKRKSTADDKEVASLLGQCLTLPTEYAIVCVKQ